MAWVGLNPVKKPRDRARFYPIDGQQYPSVTTILDVLNKPGLMYWAVNLERKAIETALLEVLGEPGARDPEWVLGEMANRLTAKKAFLKEQEKALNIGTAAHAYAEWATRKVMGEKVGSAPEIPEAAQWAVEAWKDWARSVSFKPLYCERAVYCKDCGYAGTFDWIAEVKGVVTLGDIKTSKAIYPESFLQNVAYRHAARKLGMDTVQGMILRLPKVTTDPAFEAMVVPETPLEDFLAVKRAWEWNRRMEGKPTGREVVPA